MIYNMFGKSYVYIGMFNIFILVMVIQVYATMENSQQESPQKNNTETKVYPNPARSNKIIIESEIPIKSIKVLNIVGQQVAVYNEIQATKFEMEIDTYERGIYLLVTTLTSNEVSINKVIIE